MYTLINRQVEVELFLMAQHHQLGVVCYSPLAAGVLSGKYTAKHQSDQPARLQTDMKYQKRYNSDWFYDIATAFSALAAQAGWHPVTLANSWALRHPAVSSVLAGSRNTAQLARSLDAGIHSLPDDLYEACSSLVPAPPLATDRDEERPEATRPVR